MTVQQMVDALRLCARGNPGCESRCPFASREDKYCQRALLLDAAKMLIASQSKEREARYEADELRKELEELG